MKRINYKYFFNAIVMIIVYLSYGRCGLCCVGANVTNALVANYDCATGMLEG